MLIADDPDRGSGLASLADRRFLFFGGKGGVGKTTAAAAFALWAAKAGRRVLLVSTDPAHSTGDIFGRSIGPEERLIRPNLTALEIDPEQEASRYIESVKANLRRVVSAGFWAEVERQVDLSRTAPGAEEAALFDRVAAILDTAATRHDLVVFDTAPTGHTLRLLLLPELMSAWIDGLIRRREKSTRLHAVWREPAGRDDNAAADPALNVLQERRRKLAKAGRLLRDAQTTAFVLVLIPEKLPILETEKALATLRRHRIPVGSIVVNRVLPADSEGDFLRRRRAQEAEYLDEIRKRFAAYRRVYIPLLDRDVQGPDSLARIGACLTGAHNR